MRVALDARILQHRPNDGVGRGLTNLIPFLAEAVDLDLLVDRRLHPLSIGQRQHPLGVPIPGSYAFWLQTAVPRWLRGFQGIFHCPFYWLPYVQPVPMVVTMHDVAFEHNPEWFPAARRLVFRAQGRHAVRTAGRIVTASEHVRDKIIGIYGVDPDRVLVAPNAVDPTFMPHEGADDAARLVPGSQAGGDYIVALGGAARRRLDSALSAWRLLRARGHDTQMLVVGPETLPDEPGLRCLGRLSDADWSAVLRGAVAFCYPTLYEGFGMPALESLASGTPVVCADVGALREVLGDAAEWCDSTEPGAVAAGLARVIEDSSRAAELVWQGRERVRRAPTWQDSAEIYLRAYRECQEAGLR